MPHYYCFESELVEVWLLAVVGTEALEAVQRHCLMPETPVEQVVPDLSDYDQGLGVVEYAKPMHERFPAESLSLD